MSVIDLMKVCPFPTIILDTNGKIWAMGAKGTIYYDDRLTYQKYRIVDPDFGKRFRSSIIIQLIEPLGDAPKLQIDGQNIDSKLESELYRIARSVISNKV